MSVNLIKIKKWSKMIVGKSILHTVQNIGTVFCKDELKGYYNDLTQKVILEPELLAQDSLPMHHTDEGESIYFPIAIFQYGLASYDMYLKTNEEIYHKKFVQCIEWCVKNQEENGGWSNFFYLYPDHPYSAMAQGEAVSLLARGFKETGNGVYMTVMNKALNFMLRSVSDGGTTLYDDEDVILLESTQGSAVLNGWIFSWWGLYDYVLITGDEKVKNVMDKSLKSLVKYLDKYNLSYWSLYDLGGNIASPHYQRIHVAQLQAMYALTGIERFKEYADLWEKRRNNKLCYARAFIAKAWQKIRE